MDERFKNVECYIMKNEGIGFLTVQKLNTASLRKVTVLDAKMILAHFFQILQNKDAKL